MDEFMGTLVLVLIGNGTVANVVLKKTLGSGSGWIVITTGWFMVVMAGVFTATACGSDGAHINPAVTVAVAVRTGDFSNVLPFVAAQLTGPAIRNRTANLICETIGSFLLFFIIAALLKTKPVPGLAPLLVGGVVWAIGTGLGGTTGFAINPARDLGPRIAHAILPIAGKGSSDWGYAMVPVVGGLFGGGLSGALARALM